MNIKQANEIAKNELFKSYCTSVTSVRTHVTLAKDVYKTLVNGLYYIVFERNSNGELSVPTFHGAVVIVD